MHRDDNKLEAMLERVLRKMQASQQTGWLTIPEAAAYMKSTVWCVRRLCQQGKIPYSVVGHRHILNRKDCDMHMQSVRVPSLIEEEKD
jgi:excisionase family DNA binding protein